MNDLGEQMKLAKRDSPEACQALMALARKHAAVGEQKIEYIVKSVAGDDSTPPVIPN